MGSNGQFGARVERENGVARVALSGELDLTTVPVLTRSLAQLDGDGLVAIMIDMRDLTFIDSTGLRAFLQARARAQTHGHRFLLIGATAAARRLFEVTNTNFLLDGEDAVSVLARFTRDGGGGADSASMNGASDD